MQLYGDRSSNLAKTFKVIGTLYIIQNNAAEAKNYLSQAASIFEQRGMIKMFKEVKQKLQLLGSNNQGVLMMEAKAEFQQPQQKDAISDDDLDISEKPTFGGAQKSAKKGVKKGARRFDGKKVNNFVN